MGVVQIGRTEDANENERNSVTNNNMACPPAFEPPKLIAVQVKNANKMYGKGPPILSNLNMTVTRGTIYGLLGSSGCGKTTMLSCIVGLRQLDSGEIWVYGAKPGTRESGIPGKTVGYMPQDIALYIKFSLEEILHYFGGIYGMSKSEIVARMEFLISFLDLPEPSRRIGTLSGGQQRRASLAVAMIHKPALLILDEPTVGVDPLIRESIWEYLTELVSRKRTTVIITTHYIEECRQADRVGVMRNGRLLVEQETNQLLLEHQSDLLEDIVLKLCKNDIVVGFDENPKDEVSEAIQQMSFYNKKKRPSQVSNDTREQDDGVVGIKYNSRTQDDDDDALIYQRNMAQSIRRRQSVIETINDSFGRQSDKVFSLVIRNFLTLFRNPLFVFGLLILPTFQTVLFNSIVGLDPINKHMGVVNNDFENRSFEDYCNQRETGCFKDGLSCTYLNKFGNSIIWDSFETIEEAEREVLLGNSKGYLVVPNNFTNNMKNRAAYRNFADNNTLDGSTLSLKMDFSDHLMNIFMMQQIYDNYLKFTQDLVVDCGGDPKVVEVPLKFHAIYGEGTGAREFMQPPQVLLIMFLLPMTVGVTYVWDKKAGTLDRTLVAGVDFFHVILSLLISEGLLMILELVLCISTMYFIFDFHVEGSFLLVYVLGILSGICGLSFGFIFGAFCDHEIEVMMAALAVYMPTLIASGGSWPREGMPYWAKLVTEYLPMTLPSESIRSIVSRGWGITNPNVWPGFVVLIGWIVFGCVMSSFIHRIRR